MIIPTFIIKLRTVFYLTTLLVGAGMALAWWKRADLVESMLREQLAANSMILSKFSMAAPTLNGITIDFLSIEAPGYSVSISGLEITLLSITEFELALEIESVILTTVPVAEETEPAPVLRELIENVSDAVELLPSTGVVHTFEVCSPQCFVSEVNWRNQQSQLDLKVYTKQQDQNFIFALTMVSGVSMITVATTGLRQFLLEGRLAHDLSSELTFEATIHAESSVQPFILKGITPIEYETEISSMMLETTGRIPFETNFDLDSLRQATTGSGRLSLDSNWRINTGNSSLTSNAAVVVKLKFESGSIEFELADEVLITPDDPLLQQGAIRLTSGTICNINDPETLGNIRCTSSLAIFKGILEPYDLSVNLQDIVVESNKTKDTIRATVDFNLSENNTTILASVFELTGDRNQLNLSTDSATILGLGNTIIQLQHSIDSGTGNGTMQFRNPISDTLTLQNYLNIHDLETTHGELIASADVSWNLAAESDYLEFTSDLEIKDLDLLYQGYRLDQGQLDIRLSGWPVIRSSQVGKMSWQQISVGVPIDDLETSFHLEVEPLRDIFLISGHHLKGKTLGGTFESSDYKYDVINRNGHITLTVAELELNQILALEREDFVSSGRLSGSVPVQIQEGNLSVNKGWISAISPGGRLRYSPGLSVVELAKQNKSLKVVLDAMSDFHYHTLDVELEYSKEGQLIAKTGLKGRNPAYDNGREVHLNLNLVEKNVGALLESLRLTDNVARKIESKTNSGVF